MKVALIHATTTALNPIVNAFQHVGGDIELLHFMDTGLLPMMEKSGELNSEIIRRFALLLNTAIQSEVDCIQLTCSAFNNITQILQPLYPVKLFRSDEAMLDEALAYDRIGLISTVSATPNALKSYLIEKNPKVEVTSMVEPGLIHLLSQGKREQHDEQIRKMIYTLGDKVDVIVLSQYSMEHVAEQVSPSVPILTAPKASAMRCLAYLQTEQPGILKD